MPSRCQINVLYSFLGSFLTGSGVLTIGFISIFVKRYLFILFLFVHACMNVYACLLFSEVKRSFPLEF